MGPESEFDLDGSGDKTVNIADGSTLSLAVESIDIGGFPLFSGELNIGGTLHVAAVNGANEWRSNGEITLDGGEITGRRLDNAGLIRGTGDVGATTSNSGEIIADGVSLLRVTGTNDADRITFASGSATTITGTLEVDGRTWFVPGAQVHGEGTLHAVSTVKGLFFQDGADLGGVGVTAAGPVMLTDLSESTATVRSFTMEPTASLNISLSTFPPPVNADRLIVHDDALLDGELILTRLGQDDLPVGVTMTVLTAGNITGGFDSVDDSGLGPNRRAYVTIDNDSVEVFITCQADMNADGEANFFDLSQFMILFNSMDPGADLNDDGLFNFFDLSSFLQSFDLGC